MHLVGMLSLLSALSGEKMALKDEIFAILQSVDEDTAQRISDLVDSQPPSVDVAGAITLLQEALAKLQGQ